MFTRKSLLFFKSYVNFYVVIFLPLIRSVFNSAEEHISLRIFKNFNYLIINY